MPYPDNANSLRYPEHSGYLSDAGDSDAAAFTNLRADLLALMARVDAMRPDTHHGDDAQGSISALLQEAANLAQGVVEQIAEEEGV